MSGPELPWWACDLLRAVRRGAEVSARGSVSVAPGVATALVEGRGFRPSEVRLSAPVLGERKWESFFEAFAGQALYPAALFAGYLPKPVKADLAGRGVRLVPSANLISLEPDDASPETLAGASRLVAESFAADPLRLLHFRGADREAVLGEITRRWKVGAADGPGVSLDELEEILENRSPGPASLLSAIQGGEAFRNDPVLRAGLSRLYTKVSERAAAVARRRRD